MPHNMPLLDTDTLMVTGDVFEMRYCDWYRIVTSPMLSGNVVPHRGKQVLCKVLRVYARSSYEVRYVCVSEDDKRHTEFVLAQILVPLYAVKASHPSLNVSAMLMVEARSKAGVKCASMLYPNLFTKEEAEKVAAAIDSIPLKERYGWLVPEYS